MFAWSFIALAVLAGVTKGYCGKRTSGLATQIYDAVYIGFVRFGLCALLGGIISLIQSGPWALINVDGMWLAFLSGLSQAVFATTWLLAVRTSAYIMLDAFLAAGILIPTLLCRLLYQEAIKPLQWLGFAMLLCAVCLMCSYNNSIKAKLTWKDLCLLIACSASSGIVDFSQKVLNYRYPQTSVAAFQFYSYIFAALILALITIFIKPRRGKLISVKKIGWPLAIMAACLFITSYCKQFAAAQIPAITMYSACQGGGLILSVLMAAFLFREPLKKRSLLGLVLIFLGMLLIVSVNEYI